MFSRLITSVRNNADKVLHFVISLLLTLYLGIISPGVAVVVTFSLGVLKEVLDNIRHLDLSASVGDLVADLFGVFLGALPFYLLTL